MRINKFLARSGVTSRRKADELIQSGRVKINNKVASPGDEVTPNTDFVTLDNKQISEGKEFVYYILNKPTKVLSTVSDKFGRKKVTDLVHSNNRIYPVGRLDYMSKGLILLTNDGDLALRITHPKYHLEKKYIVEVDKKISEDMIKELESGIRIYNKVTQPAKVKILGNKKFEIVLTEGMKRQIRLMCNKVGLGVVNLQRISIGPIELGNLEEGKYRELNNTEIQKIKDIFKKQKN